MSETIKIKTNVGSDSDKYLKVKIEQDFDFIEVLSLNISMSKENAYQNFCADYGVVVGRVVINSGFGVPNVKVSIFIPLDSTDSENPNISGLYPYSKVSDKNNDGVRYNLLPRNSDSQDPCYTPVGTFPTKREVLDNDDMLYVYKKYYQFTTTTNYAGDFMLFGVPVGTHIVHVDMDISNIGIASQKPYDLIAQGAPSSMFYSPTKFKTSTNLNSLPQIKTANASVNVQPFWGDVDNCQIGINRLDFDMNYNITPSAFFIGSVFGDHEKNSLNKRCTPRKKMGVMCEQETSSGTIEMIRKTLDNQIEQFDVEGGQLIDNNGTWAYQIPLNLDYMVTSEDGTLIPSESPNVGIPTRSRVRFRIGMDESGGLGRLRTRAKYLVPNNPATYKDLDLNFDGTTKDSSFTDIYWNKIYTVKNYIPKYSRGGSKFNFVGLKNVDKCDSSNSFPYNNATTNGTTFNQLLFTYICIIYSFVGIIISLVNEFLQTLNSVVLCPTFKIFNLKIQPWCSKLKYLKLNCNIDDNKIPYAPGGDGDGADNNLNNFLNCLSTSLATNLEVYQLDFYNSWINGTLYNYLLKYKRKRNNTGKYCDADCNNTDNPCLDGEIGYTQSMSKQSEPEDKSEYIYQGLVMRHNDILYYSPITNSFNGNKKLFATGLTNLGSILECDWQKFPKIINYLSPTSFKLPPIIHETETISNVIYNVSGMFKLNGNFGLFFKSDCGGVSFQNNDSLTNIKRICELGVDIPETTGSTITKVNIEQIYDTADSDEAINSVQKYIRDSFTLLNINGSNINDYPTDLIPKLLDKETGTSFGVKSNNSKYNGLLYYNLTNYNNILGTSYYMYFGLKQGNTAYDKFRNKYLANCLPSINNNFIINTNINPSSTLTANDGVMQISFIGGYPPFTTTIEGLNFERTITSNNETIVLNGLTNGVYKIVSIDSLNTTVTKEVVVSGPQRLSIYGTVLNNPTTTKLNDGSILINYLGGGTTPYVGKLTKLPNTLIGTYNLKQGDIINNLGNGEYKLNVIDSSQPSQSQNMTLTLVSPPELTLTLEIKDSESCDGSGFIAPTINGGVPPYTISATSTNGYMSGGTYGNTTFFNLVTGDYTVTVIDNVNTMIKQNVKIGGYVPMKFIGTIKSTQFGKPSKTIEYISMYDLVIGGIPVSRETNGKVYKDVYNFEPKPYNFAGIITKGWNKKDFPSSGLTITVTDKNDCSISKIFK